MKLRTKFGIVLAVVMLVLSGVVLASAEHFKRETVEQEREDLTDTANLTARQVSVNVLDKKDDMSSYVIRSNLERFSGLTDEVGQFLNGSDFNQAQVVDANGTVVEFMGDEVTQAQREQRIGADVSDDEYYTQAISGARHVELLGPSQIRRTDRRLILFSVPIGLSEGGDASGVFVAGLFVDASPRESTDQINQSSTLFGSVRPQERDTQTVRIVGKNVSGDRVMVREAQRSFDRTFNATATIGTGSGANWELTVIRDRSGLDDRVQLLQGIQLLSLLAVLGAVLGMGYWEYSTNLTQTRKLLGGFRALESGDFAHTLSLRSAEEWEQISDGFNEMATGLRDREQAIREREQRLGVLNRVLRHNLQNDMNVILGYVEMIPELDDDEREDVVETIVSKGTGLVEHGRKARQIEEAMRAAEEGQTEHDLTEIVETALEDLRAEYPDATVENDLPDALPVVAIESLRFAVESVCENALEHNDGDEPYLGVSAEIRDDAVALRIEDDGPGIPDYERKVVSEAEETDLEHGSGLGLFLATWVVEKSDGALEMEPGADGGTTVTMTLPLAGAVTERPALTG